MLEKTIVAKVMSVARSLGWFVVKIHGSAYQMAGLPDILAIKNGRAVWMEVKVPGNEPSRIQLHRMRELATAGCSVAVVYSAADARHFLENVV
jgi:Holliday junction resolvase